jgi:hypothetical protein
MKTVREYLDKEWKENGGHITKKAILNAACDRVGSYQTYADIEGLYMAVYSFWDHNIESFDVSQNDKWVGYELTLDDDKTEWLLRNYGVRTVRLIVPQWVMELNANSEFHAQNLFKKYLKRI